MLSKLWFVNHSETGSEHRSERDMGLVLVLGVRNIKTRPDEW